MAFINLSQLTKAVKGLINKINLESNATNSKIGQLSNLDTTNKDNLVAAVNEVKSSAITSETDPTVPAWAKAASKPSYTAAEVGALPDTTLYAGAGTAGGPATVANGIHYAHVDSTSTSTVYTATVTGVTQLYDGLTILLKNGVVTSASGFTININGLGAKPVYNSMAAAGRETTIFNINYTLLLIYDSTRVDGGCWINYRGYYSDSNTIPTGYCTTAAGTAAKSATCNYGYRDDDTYFPCLFRYANTAANATLAIASYATTAAPIYVNGARTSSSNTFGRGVILFLYHNGSYYCYNDGRFPVLVDGSVTSVQEYVATKYTKPSGGIPKSDLASAVQTSLGKADTALQSVPPTYRTAAAQDTIDAAQDTAIAGKLSATGDAYRAASIPMGELDSTSTATVMTAQVDGITELRDGVCVWLTNGVIASAAGVTLNINALGAKPIYNSLAGTVVTTTFAKAATYLFVYNSTRVSGGCWDMVYGYDTNTTYTPVKLGFGYATCSTAEATTAKTADLSSYTLTAGGIVAVKFTNAVPAGSTLNVNSNGAKAIYYRGAPVTADVIEAGDTVTMIYSTYYHVLSIDRDEAPVTSVNGQTGTVSLTIPSTAEDVGAIAAPTLAATGDFLCWDGSAWAATTMPIYNGGNY